MARTVETSERIYFDVLCLFYRNYQYFKFSSDNPGMVTVRTERHGVETALQITKSQNHVFAVDQMPDVLPAAGLTVERQRYLYRIVRPFVRDMYQDVTCPLPGN